MKSIQRIPTHPTPIDKNKLFTSADLFINDLNTTIRNEYIKDLNFEELITFRLLELDIHQNRFFDAEKIILNEIKESKNNTKRFINNVKLLIKIYISQEQKEKAIIFIEDRISELEKDNVLDILLLLKVEKGILHYQFNEYNQALILFTELIENYSRNFTKQKLAELYFWAGSTYLLTEELDVAFNFLNAGIKLAKESQCIDIEIRCSLILSVLSILKTNHNAIEEHLVFSYSNLDISSIPTLETNILIIYACHYYIQNKLNDSLNYLNKAIVLIEQSNYKSNYNLVYKLLNAVYDKLKLHDKAKQADDYCVSLVEHRTKISTGKHALINYPDVNVFKLAANYALKHRSLNLNSSIDNYETKVFSVLAIDDNKLNLFFTRKIISNKGYQCYIAGNFNEVKKLLTENKIDLILLDIQMPVMNGYEMFEKLVEEKLIKKGITKVVAMTGYDSINDKKRAFKLGIDDYLTKPFTPEQLNACINKLLSQKMESIERILQNQTYTYASLLNNKFGFNDVEIQKFLKLLSKQFETTEDLISESLYKEDFNEFLQVMHDLRTYIQMIDENELLALINNLFNKIDHLEVLNKSSNEIEKLLIKLTAIHKKISSEIK